MGVEDIHELEDPICDEVFERLVQVSDKNTKLYRELFRAEPDDHQTDFEKLKEDREAYQSMGKVEQIDKYKRLSPEIQGHVVDYPIYYMKDQDLELNLTDMANLVPAINFC